MLLAIVGVLVADFSANAIIVVIAIADACFAVMVYCADLPVSAVRISSAAVFSWNTDIGFGIAVFPFIALIVCSTVSLPGNTFL